MSLELETLDKWSNYHKELLDKFVTTCKESNEDKKHHIEWLEEFIEFAVSEQELDKPEPELTLEEILKELCKLCQFACGGVAVKKANLKVSNLTNMMSFHAVMDSGKTVRVRLGYIYEELLFSDGFRAAFVDMVEESYKYMEEASFSIDTVVEEASYDSNT